MPSPKDIKNLLKATQGTKAGKAMDLEELLGTLPKGTKAQQLEAELMFRRLQEEQAARYAPTNPPTKRGNAALAEAKKTLEKKQAPAVIIPSKISNVEKAVREREGEHGAKRVQRAADQIKNLEDQYTEDALLRAFTGDNAKALMVMNPADFENYAAKLHTRNITEPNSLGDKMRMSTEDYLNYLNAIPSGFSDVPFLLINKQEAGLPLIPYITGHEGRHRNRAMAQRGDPSGLVQLLPRSELREPFPRREHEEYLEALKKELEMTGNKVLPEKYYDDSLPENLLIRRPPIDLPELFAEGGGVHLAGGGGKLLKALRGADKAADATQDVQSIVNAGKPLTAAERQLLAEQGIISNEAPAVVAPKKVTTGTVNGTKVRSTVHEPERMAYPGIYQRPDVIAAEAASRVADESPNLQRVFGVTRDDLYQMGKSRQGNLPGNLPGAAAKPKGSKAAAKVMTKKNEQRLIDTMAEAEKYPALVQGMDPWYIMDPVYQRMEQLLGRDKAIEEYRKLNALMGMASPGSEVLTEIPRGTAAYYLQNQGRFSDFVKYAGQPAGSRGADFPEDILNVPGHAYHKTAQATPMQQFLESGEMQMSSPKVPMYIEASGSPLSGFQTRTPVGDAHWSRAVGLADTRGAATRKGQPVIPGASVSNPEMTLLAPWWREAIAAPMGLESVPAQARAWGTFSGQTGVTTPIGAPKLELLADKIAETAHRLGVSIEKARDLVLTGETYAGKKDGGVVHMAGGNEPGESIGEMFKPKPLTIPSPLTDMADAIKRQFNKERRSMSKPGAVTDVLLRGPVAFAAGTPMDLIGMAGEGLDYLQTKIPGLRKNASVMDEPRSVVDNRPPDSGYAPKIKFGPEPKVQPSLPFDAFQYIQTSDPKLRAFINKRQKEINSGLQIPTVEDARMPYGTEDFQEKLRRAGLTTDEERPLFELGSGIVAPFAASKALKYGKALAPTAADMLETQLLRATDPMRMNIVPDGGPSGKLKAPANEVGFYNPAEKAALNVQRKKGPGSAFVSDLKKQPGVNDERLTELGLGDLASRPSVTKEELLAAAEQNRIPLRETVRTEGGKSLEELNDDIYQLKEDMSYMDNDSREWAEADRSLTRLEREYKQEETAGRAMFGPKTHADYNMPGGQNYREIRVALPDSERKMSYEDWKKSGSSEPWSSRGVVGENFYNSTHHGDEPNVLFHLRVADHTDVDGKKGLLIDELQSDWHQKGRDKGYQGQLPEGAKVIYNNDINKYVVVKDGQTLDFGVTEQEAIKNASQKFGSVPDAPFKDNWYQLGLKRAIKEAADSGMERVYLTTGARQANRYSLSATVDTLSWRDPGGGEKRRISLDLLNGENLTLSINNEGKVMGGHFEGKSLDSVIGKDLSKKIMSENAGNLAGEGLNIGGEGMRQYYDKNYLNFLKKYAKQFDATVGETTLPGAAKTRDQLSASDMHNMMDNPEFKKILDEEFVRVANEPRVTGKMEPQGDGYFKVMWSDGTMMGGYSEEGARNRLSLGKTIASNEAKAWNAALKRFGGERVYYIDITPKMRESAAKGQSYKDGGAVAMAEGGQLTFAKANQLLRQHVAGMAEGGAVDYESRFNDMLQKHVQGMAEGGQVNEYNADPDMADGGRFIQAPTFADGGAVKSIWTVN
jgi:hypothetical protein